MSQVNPKNREQTGHKYLDAVDEILPVLVRNKFKAEDLRQVPPKTSRRCATLAYSGQSKAVSGVDWEFILSNGSRVWFVSPQRALPVDGLHRSSKPAMPGIPASIRNGPRKTSGSKNPDARVAASFAPTGAVTREGDGFRLRGRWKYLSGVDHSEWAILGGIIPADDGTGPEMRMFLVPMTDYKIDQSSWHVEGLQGTGSKDIDVDAFVPYYRTLETVEQVYKGIEPGKSVNSSRYSTYPGSPCGLTGLASPATGAALGALRGVCRRQPLANFSSARNERGGKFLCAHPIGSSCHGHQRCKGANSQ